MNDPACTCGRSVYKKGLGFASDKGYWEVDDTLVYPFPKCCPGCKDELLDNGETRKAE